MDNIHFITVADTYPCYNYKYKLAAVSTKYKLVQVGPGMGLSQNGAPGRSFNLQF